MGPEEPGQLSRMGRGCWQGPPGQAHGGNRRETEKRKQGHLGLPRAFGSQMLLSKEWECVSSELSGSSYHRSHGRKNLPEDGALSRLSQSRPGRLTTLQILKSAPRGMVSCQPALTRSRECWGATGSIGEPQVALGSHRERGGARNSTAFPAAHSQRPGTGTVQGSHRNEPSFQFNMASGFEDTTACIIM